MQRFRKLRARSNESLAGGGLGRHVFLASDRVAHREQRVRGFLASDPSVALVLGAVNFEWTICRAILFLSHTANAALREKMRDYYSLDKYKLLWNEEVVPSSGAPLLPEVVRNWSKVCQAFHARNLLVHGKDRYTRKMATPHVNELLKGVRFIDLYCENCGSPLYERMPVRKWKAAG